jgi:hypothetical protein
MIVDEEIKRRAQTIGLDLTKDKERSEITSGYLHFEKTNYNYEENSKFETTNKSSYIKTKFSEFNKGI